MKKEDVDNMTLQEACDFAMAKIVEQGERCMHPSRGCSYGGNDQHCYVGWLLDEDDPRLMDSGDDVVGLIEMMPDILPKLIRTRGAAFLTGQAFHDCDDIDVLHERLKTLSRYIDTSKPQYQAWIDLRTKQILK